MTEQVRTLVLILDAALVIIGSLVLIVRGDTAANALPPTDAKAPSGTTEDARQIIEQPVSDVIPDAVPDPIGDPIGGSPDDAQDAHRDPEGDQQGNEGGGWDVRHQREERNQGVHDSLRARARRLRTGPPVTPAGDGS